MENAFINLIWTYWKGLAKFHEMGAEGFRAGEAHKVWGQVT